jgi:hypothetical protein
MEAGKMDILWIITIVIVATWLAVQFIRGQI